MEKLLITGANGLMGQKMLKALTQTKQTEVLATSRKGMPNKELASAFSEMDITNHAQVEEVIDRFKPTCIVNTAAMTQVDDCEKDHESSDRINAEAPAFMSELCHKKGIHFVHVSTDFIFAGDHGPLDESAKPNPVNYYGQSKLKAEEAVLRFPDQAILRTVLVYGLAPHMSRSNIILWVVDSLKKGKNIQVVDDQWRTPTLAEDLAQGGILAFEKKAKGIYHISGEEMLSPYDMAMQTAQVFGLDGSLIARANSSTFTQVAKRPPKTGFIINKARKDLGYKPSSFKEGLALVKTQLEAQAN